MVEVQNHPRKKKRKEKPRKLNKTEKNVGKFRYKDDVEIIIRTHFLILTQFGVAFCLA